MSAGLLAGLGAKAGMSGAGAGMKLGGAAIGAGQMLTGAIQNRKAKQMNPAEVDPRMTSNLEDIRSRVRAASTGTDAITQNAIRQANQLTRSTQRNMGRSASGNVGALMSGMLRAQRVGGQNVNNAMASSRQLLPQFMQMESQMNNLIGQRQLELQMRDQNQMRAQGAQNLKSGFGNLMGGLGLSQKYGQEEEEVNRGQFGGMTPMDPLEGGQVDQSVTTEGMVPTGISN